MIPTSSNFPEALDTSTNLYHVHDSLRVTLAEDYNPGDTSITVSGDTSLFPSSGIVTLTEQCSEPSLRAISFFYHSRTDTTFDSLEILPYFTDCFKQAGITDVTQNVMAEHHESLKNALIAIENFVGLQGAIDAEPYGDTLEGRINFLRKMIWTPRAWFSANKRIGLVPMTVTFKDESFRLGDGSVVFTWNFGDGDISTMSAISVLSVVPTNEVNVSVVDLDGGTINKTYITPGKYDVTLTVSNSYGVDSVFFPEFIIAKTEAPEETMVRFSPRSTQLWSDGDCTPSTCRIFPNRLGGTAVDGYTNPPVIRSATNTFIDAYIPTGARVLPTPSTTGLSYAGEILVEAPGGYVALDPAETYTWNFEDDLPHPNSATARASYSVGGIYDMKIRVDTLLGAYRISTYENCIDIIEDRNLWLFNKNETTGMVNGHEFGLLSETFKTAPAVTTAVTDSSFLNTIIDTDSKVRAHNEFDRNTMFAALGSVTSGSHGTALLGWSVGGTAGLKKINLTSYEGFSDTYYDPNINIIRPWNWTALNSGLAVYFLFGPDPDPMPNVNQSYQVATKLDLATGADTSFTLTAANYVNGANELIDHPTTKYDPSTGEPESGRYAVYRSTWKDESGYILRNEAMGTMFRLRSFYKTESLPGSTDWNTIRKLSGMAGSVKTEGQLVTLAAGVFFFCNSGNIAMYNTTSGVWETGGPAPTASSFHSLMDTTVEGYGNISNTLMAASDGDRVAYLSFDYSTNAFIKFNTADLTFSRVGSRPSGLQFIMGVY